MHEKPDTQKRFEACVETCSDSMYRVAFRLTGNSVEAEDLVQESYSQAWQKIDSLRDTGKMRSWMFAILRNQYLKRNRAKRPFVSEDVESIADPQSLAPQDANSTELIQQALDQLDEDQRLPILLVSMEGVSVEEASEIIGVPRGTILSRMHRGRQKLKDIITKMQTC